MYEGGTLNESFSMANLFSASAQLDFDNRVQYLRRINLNGGKWNVWKDRRYFENLDSAIRRRKLGDVEGGDVSCRVFSQGGSRTLGKTDAKLKVSCCKNARLPLFHLST